MTVLVACICLLFTAGVLFYVFYLPGVLVLGPEKTRAAYLRERNGNYEPEPVRVE